MNKKPDKKSKLKKNRRENLKKNHPVLNTLFVIFLSCLLIGVIVCSCVGIYVLTYTVSFANGDLAINLDEYKNNQNQTTIIYAYDNNNTPVELTRLHGEENRIWLSISEMPQDLKDAFISLEDKRFPKHNGVDWFRTASVIVKERFKQGGSTITQQLIKNLTGENQRTFKRKFNEILYALNLEKHYSKDTILEAYLNTLYLDQGCYGVKTAAELYFGKEVSELNLAECASLAAITQEPYTYDPLLHPEKNAERQKVSLNNMLIYGYISQQEHDDALAYKMVFTNSPDYVDTSEKKEEKDLKDTYTNGSQSEYPSYYVEYVIDSVIRDMQKKYNFTYYDAWRKVFYGGLKIYTYVNLEVQSIAENVYVNRITFPKEQDTPEKPAVQSAITIMDYEGRVVAMVGGAGEKPGFRCLNRATNSPRQPGSSIKPLSVYTLAVEKNYISWSSKIQNYGILLNGIVWPHNYGGSAGSPSSFVTVQYAIAQSLNTVPAQLAKMMTPQSCFDFLKDTLHITTLNESGEGSDIGYSSMAVGGMYRGVTTLEMASAYAIFGNNGKYYSPCSYSLVTNNDGSEVLLNSTANGYEQAIAPDTSEVMRRMMETVVVSGSAAGYSVKSGMPLYAKTGTTSDYFDRWYCGGTPYYVAAVWYGYDVNTEIRNVSGNPAGKIYLEIMKEVHKNLEIKEFPSNENVVKLAYCTRTGLIASAGCTSKSMGWYKMSSLPSTCTSCVGTGEDSSNPTEPVEESTLPPEQIEP